MTRLEPQPFFDDRGNLVIPQQLLRPQREETVLTFEVLGEALRILLHARLALRFQSITETGEKVITAKHEAAEDYTDMLVLARSSMDFWDNPIDDVIWNHA